MRSGATRQRTEQHCGIGYQKRLRFCGFDARWESCLETNEKLRKFCLHGKQLLAAISLNERHNCTPLPYTGKISKFMTASALSFKQHHQLCISNSYILLILFNFRSDFIADCIFMLENNSSSKVQIIVAYVRNTSLWSNNCFCYSTRNWSRKVLLLLTKIMEFFKEPFFFRLQLLPQEKAGFIPSRSGFQT